MLLDEEGEAAGIAGTKSLGMASLIRPRQILAAGRATVRGNVQHNLGRRPNQLGATLVIGPGDELLYEDFEDYAGDHADIDDVLAVLRR